MANANIKDAAVSAFRVWIITTIGLWIPGLLGWINEVTKWADQKGAPPFPDPSNLAYLFVAALTAAFPAAVAGVLRLVENWREVNVLPRASGPQPKAVGQRGSYDPLYVALFVLVVIVIAILLL